MFSNMTEKGRDMPYMRLIGFISVVFFVIIWMLDSVFLISVILNSFIPLIIRFILFSIIICLGIIFIYLSRKAYFPDGELTDIFLTQGIFSRVRHPLYLGGLLVLLSFIFLSISLISIALIVILFILLNKMTTYEEKILEDIFGNLYLDYRKRVPKWIPKLKKNNN
ncbi:hypothetical protein LCGC14_1010710 [marine sediment metagenome]|uniref:Steroid 5-alpha reductase C-terminal domain-containing protein n=1 Tax=marine sediment metagenome TaxID=412755 RepID=A0A0F9QIK8_9ZZZZ|nr:MAG: hypothetical protein Lokiarch_27110 [Candidatus Lokiarchaeum sp. GC14_75]HEC38983.1 DUF1295 domain-containing protein [bacterium]